MTFTLDLSAAALLVGVTLFGLRVLNYSIGTMRLIVIGQGRRLLASAMAFTEAFIFAVVMASVVTDLNNLTNLLSYCLGAAVGSYIGMWLEGRFIVSYSTVTIITHEKGEEITAALRNANYGVTVSRGEGRDGEVEIIRSSAVNRDVPALIDIVRRVYPNAFVDVEAARIVRKGWIPGGPPRRA